MVTSVHGSSLGRLHAQEQALANRSQTPPAGQGGPLAPGGAGDPAVVYAGQDGAPSLSAILAVGESLNRAASIADVGVGAGRAIAGLISVLREKAEAAKEASTADARAALEADYQAALATIDQLAKSASFQGVKILDGHDGQDLQFRADPAGEAVVSLTPRDFTAGGPVIGLGATSLAGGPGELASLLERIDAASNSLAGQLQALGAQSEQIQAHLGVIGQLQSALAGGGGGGDADAARLQALAVQQALTSPGASVANRGPQALLSLFRG